MSVFGEDHPQAKLTEIQAREIYRLAHEGLLSQRTIAVQFGISQPTVADIKARRLWGWLWSDEENVA